jgi:hypothetical protein
VNFTQQHCYVFPKIPYTLTGFELGSSVPEADAMLFSATPPRQGKLIFLYLLLTVFEQLLF